jgi:hypothetical protein
MRMHSPIHHFFFCLCVLLCLSRGWFCPFPITRWFFSSHQKCRSRHVGWASERNGPVLSLALPTKWKRFVFQFFLLCFFPQEKVIPRFLFLFIKKQKHIVFPQKKVIGLLWETQPDCLKRKGKIRYTIADLVSRTQEKERRSLEIIQLRIKRGYEKQTCRRLLSARIYLRRIRKPRLAIKCVRPVASWLPARAQVARFVALVEK